ncbi:MAG: UbiA family prenyltransferase [Candidatus Thermoplasmatota archaeon]
MSKTDFLWNELIYGGHWFSISASALVLSIMIILQVQIRWELLLIIYLQIQCLFNYNHYKELEIDIISKSDRSLYLKKYIRFLPFLTILYGFGFTILILYFGNFLNLAFAISLFVLGLLFTKIFKKWTSKIIGFKTFYTAITFASFFILFINFYCSNEINFLVISLFIIFFFRFMIGTGFSDIKDIEIDQKQNLKTFPVYFGKEKFLNILHIINILTFIAFVIILFTINIAFILISFFTYVYTLLYIEKAKKEKTNTQLLTQIYIDGEFIFWPIILLLGLIIFN